MKFCCTSAVSSKQRKSLKKNNENKMKKPKEKINHSLLSSSPSSSIYYSTMSSSNMKKYDSGFSETATTVSSMHVQETILEQILSIERIYYQNLKQSIIKYSRPLRRYLNPDEIIDLFQNIEKISAISESIVRQCEKLLDSENLADLPISIIFHSWSGVMIDSYTSYLTRCVQAQAALKQCQSKIAYFLQLPTEYVAHEISQFIILPIRHICLLNDLLQSSLLRNQRTLCATDRKIAEDVRLLARQANVIFQSACSSPMDNTLTTLDSTECDGPNVTMETSQNTTIQSEIIPMMVLQRTNREPWEPKRLDLLHSQLCFTQLECLEKSMSTTSIPLSNVVHIEEDGKNEEIRLIVAAPSSKPTKVGSVKMMRVYIRFECADHYQICLHELNGAVQQAKDQTWSKTSELLI